MSNDPETVLPTTVRSYSKKPVTIQAILYTGYNGYDVGLFVGQADRNRNNQFMIHTLEGPMAASPGDYVIKGVEGEFYPCKPNIFEKTYELVREPDLEYVEKVARNVRDRLNEG